MAAEPARIKEIFLTASDKQGQERAAYLDEACGADAEMRRRVEALLAAHDEAGSFLEHPPEGAAAAVETGRRGVAAPEEAGTRIGVYKLLQQIGEGGMGTVWMAEQQEPVRRMVALKVIKAGLDSAQVIARFEAERQALALMDHPNIAKVLDAGTTEFGRPYFVMELVKGVPITTFCDERKLTPRDRLELFVPVCQAVQHAHQKGVIHRDLKPSNVMVALYDGRPVPKVIDFGVAKATGQKLTDKTLFTGFGAVVGTLEYMSPEQAELNQLDIDTRSDVYSLGVLLYELLTGSTPLERKRLREGALLEMLRVIREEEPPRPSARLSSSETLANVAAQRRTEPARLAELVRGELDWIVMKALEKDRSRRYETANALARDIQRYLADEAVEACPPTRRYRFRKFVRKHRAALVTASAFVGVVLVALIAGLVAVGAEQRQTARERDRALDAEGEATANLKKARANLNRARTAEKEATDTLTKAQENLMLAKKAVNDTFDLAKTHPLLTQESMRAVRKLLFEKALPFYKNFRARRAEDPEAQADLADQWDRVGNITRQIGSISEARKAWEQSRRLYQALVKARPGVPGYQNSLARTLIYLGNVFQTEESKTSEALKAYTQARDIMEKLVKAHPQVLDYRETQAMVLSNLALSKEKRGWTDEAFKDHTRSIALWEKLAARRPPVFKYQSQLSGAVSNLAGFLTNQGKTKEALAAYARARAIQGKLVEDAPGVTEHQLRLARLLFNMGLLLDTASKQAEAVKVWTQASDILEKLIKGYPDVTEFRYTQTRTLAAMGKVLMTQGKNAEALKALNRGVDIGEQLAKEQPGVIKYLSNLTGAWTDLALVLQDEGRLDEALKQYRRVRPYLEKVVKTLPADPVQRNRLAVVVNNIGAILRADGKRRAAIDAFTEAIHLREDLVKGWPERAEYRTTLAQTYISRGEVYQDDKQVNKAIPSFTAAIRHLEIVLTANPCHAAARQHLFTGSYQRALCLRLLGRHRQAIADWNRAIELAAPAARSILQRERAFGLAMTGDHHQAMSEARALAKTTRAGVDWHRLVLIAAACSFGASRDASRPLAWREHFAEQTARQAVVWLKEADQVGYFKSAALRKVLATNPEFDTLRHRDDFKGFVKQLTDR